MTFVTFAALNTGTGQGVHGRAMTLRRPLLLAATLLLAAAPAPPLSPGLWRFTNTPSGATLDGRPLKELPVGLITSESVCLTPEQAAAPAQWLARDLLADCSLTRTTVANGRVDIAGGCPARGEGFAAGTLTVAGRYTATSYRLRFATIANGENGRMGFSGAMTGERVGPCPS